MPPKRPKNPIKRGQRVTTLTLYQHGIWGTVANVTPAGICRVDWDDGVPRRPKLDTELWRRGSHHPLVGKIVEGESNG